MFNIHLQQLKFHGHHGILDEETLIGNNFEVSVTVNFIAKGPIESLSDTVNYVELHHIIKEIFHQPVKLLETLAEEI
ncbi:MAG TPA: hypothetical protein DCX70_00360 [Chitinophagaceae bacterium]|nr:hypothetical protein [Chitinophagaceae bacterium]